MLNKITGGLVLPLYKGELEGVELEKAFASATPPNLPLERGGAR
jgi:hypothetical protein